MRTSDACDRCSSTCWRTPSSTRPTPGRCACPSFTAPASGSRSASAIPAQGFLSMSRSGFFRIGYASPRPHPPPQALGSASRSAGASRKCTGGGSGWFPSRMRVPASTSRCPSGTAKGPVELQVMTLIDEGTLRPVISFHRTQRSNAKRCKGI
jgi:hypothetical protein